MKAWLWQGASLSLAVGLLAVLLGRQDWAALGRGGPAVRWTPLALTAGLGVVYWALRVARWRWMVAIERQRIGWATASISMLAGLGVGLLTPFRGGEVVRPMFVPKGARVRLAGWVLIERMFDLSAVMSLCLLGLAYMIFAGAVKLTGGGAVPAWLLLVCPLLLAVALGVPLVIHYRPARLWARLSRVLPGKARELAEVRLNRRQFGIFYATSVCSEVLSVLTVYACLQAFGRIDLLSACAIAPIVMLHNLLPATPGGFGVREFFAVGIFGALDLPGLGETAVLAAYLANPIIVLVVPGAIGVLAAYLAGLSAKLRANP